MLLVSLKKVTYISLVAFGLFFMVQSPDEAARVVRVTGENTKDLLGEAGGALIRFVTSLV